MAKGKTTIEEIRGKDTRELLYDLEQLRKDLFNARFQPEAESTNTSNIRTLRRTIARILTVVHDRELASAKAPEGGSES